MMQKSSKHNPCLLPRFLLGSVFWLSLLLPLFSPALQAAEQITYYHYDAMGSPVAATDENGNLLWKETCEPFGKRLRKEDGGTNNNWYTGKQHDTSIGLSYFGARWYDPNIGRFMAIDPAAINPENIYRVNRYAYANNNPYKFVDPDGWEPYLVSRPLDLPIKGNHNFIVSNAKYLGGLNATVSSFGDIGNDTMGLVNKNTKGFSKGTNATDKKAWKSLSDKQTTATYRKINAKDSVVDNLVGRVDKGLEYSLIPEIQGGVNSNTGAGAVAKKADGGSSSVRNGIRRPGSSVTDRIKFKSK